MHKVFRYHKLQETQRVPARNFSVASDKKTEGKS